MTTTDTAPAEGTTETAGKPATSANTTKAPKQCGCLVGTGQTCDRTTGKAFAQGHDARLASRLAQAVAKGEMTVEEATKLITEAGGSDLLIGKMRHSAELRKNSAGKPKAKKDKPAKDASKAPEPSDAPEAKAQATPGDPLLGTKVKVAHGDKTYDAVVLKNAASVRVARHRLIGQNCDHSVEDDGTTGEKVK
jgi:hypothetical protein